MTLFRAAGHCNAAASSMRRAVVLNALQRGARSYGSSCATSVAIATPRAGSYHEARCSSNLKEKDMGKRESIQIPPIGHANPIPFASRVGNMFFTGSISGRDPETREMPASVEKQAENCFAHLSKALAKVGGSLDDVGHVTVVIKEEASRAKLNTVWVKLFPDEDSRPA